MTSHKTAISLVFPRAARGQATEVEHGVLTKVLTFAQRLAEHISVREDILTCRFRLHFADDRFMEPRTLGLRLLTVELKVTGTDSDTCTTTALGVIQDTVHAVGLDDARLHTHMVATEGYL